MSELYSSVCISSVCSTVLSLFGDKVPENIAAPDKTILEYKNKVLKDKNIDRAVIYNPDAVALWLYMKYTDMFSATSVRSPIALPRLSVMPSVTPVCFASMYSGLMPEIHGIRKYEKPVLTVKTLFDYLIENGKKPAIVSSSGDSISKIFLERNMDYFIFDSIEEVNEKALSLIDEDKYDLIVIYNGNYDSKMHKFAPESKEALGALKENNEFYSALVDKINAQWKNHDVFYGFCPDHGCHEIDGNCGSHGLEMQEDMNVIHFYGISPAEK